ncbi:MAG: LON peptidase substrate-binding domain-containing protein [Dongiaceae bacterium]
MTHGPFDPTFDALPATLPIFPLPGAVLLPRGKLPLNIFEPRYLAMTRDALASDRLIGMIQPTEPESDDRPQELYKTGCAGRITTFSETDDGRYLVTLTGLCRFGIEREVPSVSGYRRVMPDFQPYRSDMEDSPAAEIARESLLSVLKIYLKAQNISVDWKAIADTPDDWLVTLLAMMCPFEVNEKQALLEAKDTNERAHVLTALLELATMGRQGQDSARH